MVRERRDGPLSKVGKAADNASALVSSVRKYGVDVMLTSTKPLTIRVQVGSKEVSKEEMKGIVPLLLDFFKRGARDVDVVE